MVAMAVLFVATGVSPAFAMTISPVGVSPAQVQIVSKGGYSGEVVLTVLNGGAEAVRMEALIETLDAGPSGGGALLAPEPGAESWSPAAWLTLSASSFLVPGGGEQEVVLLAEVPPDAEPGAHVAIVDIRREAAGARSEAIGVSVTVGVTVEGEVVVDPTIEIDVPRVSYGDPEITVLIGNEGTVHYTLDGGVTIEDGEGEVLSVLPVGRSDAGEVVLPGAEREFSVVWEDSPVFGWFSAEARFDAGSTAPLIAKTDLWVVRWQPLVGAGLGLVAAALLVAVSRRFLLLRSDALGRR
jgi:hypothetical protein